MNRWINNCMNRWMNRWIDESMGEWIDEWIDGWMHRWMNRWANLATSAVLIVAPGAWSPSFTCVCSLLPYPGNTTLCMASLDHQASVIIQQHVPGAVWAIPILRIFVPYPGSTTLCMSSLDHLALVHSTARSSSPPHPLHLCSLPKEYHTLYRLYV